MLCRRLLAGAVAAGSLAASLAVASPASAAPLVWVQSGGSTSGTVTFTAKNTSVFRMANLRSGAFVDCPIGAVTITGTITLGTARPNPPLTTITGSTFVEGSCRFSGLNFRVAGAASSANPWNANVTGSSTPTSAVPVNRQTTPGSITNVLARTVTINPSTPVGSAPGASDCSVTLGAGIDSGNATPGTAGTISPVTYTNAATPTISILTTSQPSAATLGVNRAFTGPLPGITKPAGMGCFANAYLAGDKAQIRSSASATTPVTFAVTNSGPGPLWVRA